MKGKKGIDMEEKQVFLTVQEAAKLLRMEVSWVYQRTRVDGIPMLRLGKYVVIPSDDLLRWAYAGCPRDWRGVEGVRAQALPNDAVEVVSREFVEEVQQAITRKGGQEDENMESSSDDG